ncbi:transmembrane protein 165 isoform X2 [Hippopotamus amphibius kiboko]|uniref:transmembrane protein 165 isoform X2 n=1 Tax=Hippopotamus amphibius kiboko TaxID=575201 RepID=UPI002595F834|nr:transmembrane protein 165 isoform X2 [Hippopotamus amphibius kiboko]
MGGRPRRGRGPEELGRAALRQLAEACGRRGRGEGDSRLRTPACSAPPVRPGHFPHAAGSSLRGGGGGEAWGTRPGTARGRGFQSPALPPEAPERGRLDVRDGGGPGERPRIRVPAAPASAGPAAVDPGRGPGRTRGRAQPPEQGTAGACPAAAAAVRCRAGPRAGAGRGAAQYITRTKGFTPAAPVLTNKEDPATQTNLGFIHAFVAAISVIIVSELGDKTFFIAAIMAMRYNRLTVLAGAMLALGLMTCLSVLFGYATTVIPRVYTYYVSTALFAIFGIRMLREGLKMSPDEGQEELEEVQAELKKKDEEFQRTKLLNGPGDVETGTSTTIPQKKWLHFISPIFVQALTLTFLAEWGDRSQLTTIVLAAREDPYGVAVGGTVGHCLCTGLAVIGGRMIAQKISVRTVTIIGGIVFLAFAFSALFISPDAGF